VDAVNAAARALHFRYAGLVDMEEWMGGLRIEHIIVSSMARLRKWARTCMPTSGQRQMEVFMFDLDWAMLPASAPQ